jgi:DNA-binding transcriptional MerR regulator
MNDTSTTQPAYSISEAAKLCGLPESTLRYYETIGIIDPIERDKSTKRRVYTEEDVNLVIAIACLNATGLSIDDMRSYLKNRNNGAEGAHEQVKLLTAQEKHLADELHYMQLRLRYVKSKIDFWNAVEAGDDKQVEATRLVTHAIAQEMKLPKSIPKERSGNE